MREGRGGRPMLLRVQHFSVDGDFGIEDVLALQEHLHLCHECLCVVPHLVERGVPVVESCLVLPPVLVQLVHQLPHLLLQQLVLNTLFITLLMKHFRITFSEVLS